MNGRVITHRLNVHNKPDLNGISIGLLSQDMIVEILGQKGNWRPITMLTFLVLVVCDSFGPLKFRLADEAWTLL